MSYYLPVNVTVLLSLVIFIYYLLGIQNMLTSFPQNDCEMTFMFQYPQFVEIFLPPEVQKFYPKYTLYGYSEGGFTVQLRKMKFKGVPVLFIPGSSGSHKQGRSLASVSLRKSLNSRSPFHFNYFMIDFNEEQAAIFGGVLKDQTKFVAHSIKKILSLYKNNDNYEGMKPDSVILIGHSLGGILAKGVFMEPDFDPNLVHLIVTLASPHKYPLIQFDSYITNYYNDVYKFWQNNKNLSHINLISLSGGPKDVIVNSDVTVDINSGLNVVTTAIPGVWLPNDHLSIMWCKQLILVINRALFDSVDMKTKQLSKDKEYVNTAFQYHLVKRSAGKKFAVSEAPRFSVFDKSQHWFENLQRQFTVTEPHGVKTNHYVMIRLFSEPKSEMAFFEAYNINTRDWVYACNADLVYNSMRICESGENLSNTTEIAPVDPELKLKRKFIYLNLFDLKAKSFSHVIVKIPPSDTYVSLNVDVYQSSERNINLQVPAMYSYAPRTIISNTHNSALVYNINLIGFEYIWQSYAITLHSLSCKTTKNNAVISFIVPWLNGSQHFYFGDKKSLSSILSLMSPKPKHYGLALHPTIRLHLDPTCKYRMVIQPSIIGLFTQGARFHSLMLPAYVSTVVLLTVRQQIIFLNNGKCFLFHSALSTAVRRYYLVLLAVILGSKLLGFSLFHSILPVPDFLILQKLNLDSLFFLFLLYGVAVMVTYAAGAACYMAIVMSGQAAHKMALRFFAKTISGVINWSEWIISALHQVPIIAAVTLASLAMSTCGALSLWLGTLFYFLKLCKMYEEYLDEWFNYSLKLIAKTVRKVVKGSKRETESSESQNSNKSEEIKEIDFNKDSNEDDHQTTTICEVPKEDELSEEVDLLSAIHFHTSVFMIWLLCSLLYIPSLLMWAKNYNYRVFLEKDPSMIPSIIASFCGAILWQHRVPRKKKSSQTVTGALYGLSIFSIIYASFSLHRMGIILSAGLVVLALNQCLSFL